MERNVCALLHRHHRVGLWGVGGGRGEGGGGGSGSPAVQVQVLVDEHGAVSVVAIVDISAPGAHLPLAADVRPDARHVADVRARARSGHLLLGLKNARREEREAQADAGKPTRDSHGRGSRATQSEPRGDEVRTHRRDPATTGAGLRTLIGTASSSRLRRGGVPIRRPLRARGNRTTSRLHPRHSSHRAASLDLLIIPRHRQEKLFNNLRRGDRWTPQRVAPRHCDARADSPERSGASQPCRSASRYPRSSLRERLDTCCRRVVEGIVSSRRGERTRRDSRRAA